MKRETLLERKRFAAELAERDRVGRLGRRSQGHSSDVAGRGQLGATPSVERLPGRPSNVVAKPEPLPPTDAEILERYRMRRWWLDRYSLDEIRALAEGLR